ncbi:hypothetical protein OV450_3769 [Actinobacteria bacterium OV450]|nr:hypothetical protein OV450_3769 [Actinobacteria bacterium OV450]
MDESDSMKILGFYQELWPEKAGTPAGSIRDFIRQYPAVDEADVARYLGTGHELIVFMGAVGDILGSDYRILGGDNIVTDGEWVWRADIDFYLTHYHLALPEEFLRKARENQYAAPDVSRDQLLKIDEEVHMIL